MNKKRLKLNLALYLTVFLVIIITAYYYIPKMFADEVYPLKYENFIVFYSKKYNVDPALVAAVILQESRFNPSAVSGAGAQGLMQFMPGTAATMAKETGRWPNYNIFDAETSVEFGAAHLRDLLAMYNGNVDLALYAYNTGTGSVAKYINSPSSVENYPYVKKIKNYRTVYKTIYASELSIEPIKLDSAQEDEEKEAKIRGFVWTQLFSDLFSFNKEDK